MNQDWLDQYKGVEYLKNKKERDWKFIIGMIVLLAIFAVMGGAFWNMVGKQAQIVREEEQKEEANAISAIYIETGEFLKTGVFVDLNNGTIFSADIPAEGIYNKKGKLISDDVLENGDKVKIYGGYYYCWLRSSRNDGCNRRRPKRKKMSDIGKRQSYCCQ